MSPIAALGGFHIAVVSAVPLFIGSQFQFSGNAMQVVAASLLVGANIGVAPDPVPGLTGLPSPTVLVELVLVPESLRWRARHVSG